MRKWISLLFGLVLCVSVCASALAAEPQFANTKAFLAYMDEIGISYNFLGAASEDTEAVQIPNQTDTDQIPYDFVLIFPEDNTCVSIRIWDFITIDPGKTDEVLRAINQLNGGYKYIKWYVDEENNTINVDYDLIVREGTSVPDIVMEAMVRLYSLIEEGYVKIAGYAK